MGFWSPCNQGSWFENKLFFCFQPPIFHCLRKKKFIFKPIFWILWVLKHILNVHFFSIFFFWITRNKKTLTFKIHHLPFLKVAHGILSRICQYTSAAVQNHSHCLQQLHNR